MLSPSKRSELNDVCVVSGAGPVGCLAALLLANERPELSVLVLEKRDDHRKGDLSAAELRSINLALSDRGRKALRAVGLEEQVLQGAIPMRGRAVHLPGDRLAFQHYDDVEGTKCIYSVSRRMLNDAILMELEKKKNVKVIFKKRVTSIERLKSGKGLWVNTGDNEKIRARFVMGCDGSYSSVREAMSRLVRMDFHRTYIELGYMELHIPANTSPGASKYKLDPFDALHIWPREEESHMMMIALPNTDGSFTATLFAPFATLTTLAENEDKFNAFMKKHYAECLPFLDGSHGGAHALFTSTVAPWAIDGLAVLLGDAAHSQVPFFGQGMNAGLEDAMVFAEYLKQYAFDWDQAVREFEPTRRPCGDAITQLSLENYEEMHTKAGSLLFRLRRRFEGFLARLFRGRLVVPLYYAVAFTTQPYDEILRGKRRSQAIEDAVRRIAIGGATLALGFLSVPYLHRIRG